MTDPKHIHDYLDGALDADGEAALFASLGTDAAGRRELTDQIHLHLAVKKDMAAIAVPVEATNAIFGELGFPLPATAPARRRGGVVLLMMMVGVLMLLQNTEYRIQSLNQGTRTESKDRSRTESKDRSRDQGSIMMSAGEHGETDVAKVSTQQTLTPMQEAPSDMQMSVMNVDYDTRFTPMRPALRKSDRGSMTAIAVDTTVVSAARSPFSVVLGGLGTVASTPNVATEVNSSVVFDQFTVGVQYDLSEADRVSIVGGRQRIPQEFTRTEFGRDVVYRQAPTLPWIGARYERSFRELGVENVFTPFASVGAGWMQTGPYGRLGLGLHVMPHQQLSFDVGIETTTLLYPIQSTTYTSTTWSIVYGLSYRF